jgi:hypothetical protein
MVATVTLRFGGWMLDRGSQRVGQALPDEFGLAPIGRKFHHGGTEGTETKQLLECRLIRPSPVNSSVKSPLVSGHATLLEMVGLRWLPVKQHAAFKQ